VLGDSGPISLPPNSTPAIAPDGTVTVVDPAAPDQPPQELGRIKLAGWQGSPIGKGLDGLFRVEGGGVLPRDDAATVRTGSLEQSNVNTTEVLVDMIDAQRLFAMRSKLIATARDVDEGGAQLMRLS
jgi:flagellar basal-body rod protein FlgF